MVPLRIGVTSAKLALRQEYLLDKLVADAEAPTLDEVLDRIGHRTGGRLDVRSAAALVRADRNAR